MSSVKLNKSASRVMDILILVSKSDTPLTISQISRELDIPKSSTFEILMTMVEKGFLEIDENVELIHDVHERVAPIEAVRIAKQLEPYRLFYLEDPVAPEQIEWIKMIRQQSATPIAMGELFSHPNDWKELISNRMIDFIRCHISAIGGITPAKKLANFSEAFDVRTAWHGPGDVSPVGHMANIHLDISTSNHGTQEWQAMSEPLREVFPGIPEVENGYVYPNELPGLGIYIDEEKAAKYPCFNVLPKWTLTRLPDGTSVRP